MFSAGEASGDAYGAALVEELKSRGSDSWTIEAIGGPRLRDSGATLLMDSSQWAAISFTQSLAVGSKVVRGFLRAKRALRTGKPGIFVPIDFGTMNIRLARYAKALGWRVLYFVPPGSWRRDRQGADLPKITDAIVTPFSWSAEILNSMGADAHWFGHPVLALMPDPTNEVRTTIAVLPGSRRHEIQHNLPVMAQATQEEPEIEIAVAATVNLDALKKHWRDSGGNPAARFVVGDVYGVLRRARMGVICSGTATLQAAVSLTPMVVIYKFSKITEIEGRIVGIRKRLKMFSLPNIMLNRMAVPELAQEAANPEAIRAWVDLLKADTRERWMQLEAFQELGKILGPPDAIRRTADILQDWTVEDRR